MYRIRGDYERAAVNFHIRTSPSMNAKKYSAFQLELERNSDLESRQTYSQIKTVLESMQHTMDITDEELFVFYRKCVINKF